MSNNTTFKAKVKAFFAPRRGWYDKKLRQGAIIFTGLGAGWLVAGAIAAAIIQPLTEGTFFPLVFFLLAIYLLGIAVGIVVSDDALSKRANVADQIIEHYESKEAKDASDK